MGQRLTRARLPLRPSLFRPTGIAAVKVTWYLLSGVIPTHSIAGPTMSFDLTLAPRPGKPPLERQAFLNHFTNKKLHHHDGDTVNYHNEDTGVYFHLTWHSSASTSEEVEENTSASGPS